MTLRDRLIALADADAVCDDDKPYTRSLALAAAKMALEDAEACNKHNERQPHTFASENADRYRGFRDGAIACQNTIRTLRDGLD